MCDNINFIARDYFLNALKNFYVFLCNKDFLKNFKLKFGTFSLGNLCTPRWKEACAMKILSLPSRHYFWQYIHLRFCVIIIQNVILVSYLLNADVASKIE